jgi:dUTP pyrophosphatase
MHRGVYDSGNITGEDNPIPKAFKLHARSSIGKRYIRLANNVGIIDRGYRGEIGAIVDNLHQQNIEKIEKGQRLFQICMPDLEPFIVKFCGRDDSNLNQTQRGSGGFGSTGGT